MQKQIRSKPEDSRFRIHRIYDFLYNTNTLPRQLHLPSSPDLLIGQRNQEMRAFPSLADPNGMIETLFAWTLLGEAVSITGNLHAEQNFSISRVV